jgi:hypothetical protein
VSHDAYYRVLVFVWALLDEVQEDWAPVLQCVFRVLDAHPTSLELAGSGLECLTALAPGLSEPAAVLHQLLRHEPVQALCRQRAPGRGLRHQLVLATSALQARMVSTCVLPSSLTAMVVCCTPAVACVRPRRV